MLQGAEGVCLDLEALLCSTWPRLPRGGGHGCWIICLDGMWEVETEPESGAEARASGEGGRVGAGIHWGTQQGV